MANKSLFNSSRSITVPTADTTNEAGGRAYSMSDKHALAQYVVTGALGDTYYADAKVQLDKILELTKNVSPKYIAQAALYAREKGFMKDAPSLLCAVLAVRDVELLKAIFNRVIDNGKMLRNFAQIIRSNAVGRKSFGSAVKKLMQRWFASRSDKQLFNDSVGNDPSLADVIKMVHPSPANKTREALYGYICGKKVVYEKADTETIKLADGRSRTVTVMFDDLPECVQEYETFKKAVLDGKKNKGEVPDVSFQLLTALNLGTAEWTAIAENAKWTMTRMNLNTFQRHGVFNDAKMVSKIADRLSNSEEVKKSRCFPYQLLAAYKNVEGEVPSKIVNALQEAMEIATLNVPEINGKVYIMVDVSGSMHSSVTGHRGTATSKVSCLDVACLMASSLLRQNKDAEVIPFSDDVVPCRLNPHDSVMTNSMKLAKLPSGGTSCSAPIRYLNAKNAKGDLIIMISDSESWRDMSPDRSNRSWYGNGGTAAHTEWALFNKRNPKARMVAIDITPYSTTQIKESPNTLNVGGFSDNVFSVVSAFVNGELDNGHWVGLIDQIEVGEAQSPVIHAAKTGASKAVAKNKIKRDKNGRFK